MGKQQQILLLLEENKSVYLSGEKISDLLQISRNSVWKYIQQLKQEGFLIDAVRNKGYRLSYKNDKITVQGITLLLKQEFYKNIVVVPSVDSTNNVMKKIAIDGGAQGTVSIACHQTNGRGRMGRKFYSPEHQGIYMSILLRPPFSFSQIGLLTSMAAVAVCRAIEETTDKCPQIKWVNDIFLDGKKIGGILTESSTSLENGEIEYIVLGIGVNFIHNTIDLPVELKNKVGSIFGKEVPTITKNILIAEILNQVYTIQQNADIESAMKYYKQHSILLNEQVLVIEKTRSYLAKAIDFDREANLIVELPTGNMKTLFSGDISIRGEFYE